MTPDATEEKPVEVQLETPEGIPEAHVTHTFHNAVVDSAGPETGLYVRLEFGIGRDYDLYMYDAAGEEAAHAAGYNPAPVLFFDGTGSGGHSEQTAEQLDGIKVADCSGWTFDIAGYMTEGQEVTLKFWHGEAAYEPGGEGRAVTGAYSAVMSLF